MTAEVTRRSVLADIDAAGKRQEPWEHDARDIIDLYSPRPSRDRYKRRHSEILPDDCDPPINILNANTTILAAAMYSNTPKPDVRRRFRDKDPIGKEVSRIVERALIYAMDAYDFDGLVKSLVLDLLLTGRAKARVRLVEHGGQQGMPAYQEVRCERVQYDDFRHSPATMWGEVTWVAYRHWMTKEQVMQKFGIDLGDAPKRDYDDGTNTDSRRAYREDKVEVWERWDKCCRAVQWVTEAHDEWLAVEQDPYRLMDFFPTPRPMLSVETPGCIDPIPEYLLYRRLAEELNDVEERIILIVRAIRVRGLYDAGIVEFEDLMDAEDTKLIPAQNLSRLREKGGIEGSVWFLPIEMLARMLPVLVAHAGELLQKIYEMTGISDIIRGSSKATETARAQSYKVRYASLRLDPRQRQVARFVRDLLRLKAEIFAERFAPQSLAMMTGVELPAESKDPGVPSWAGVMRVLKDELMMSYRIDIQTDSTIADVTMADQEELRQLLQAIGGFIQTMAPIVQSGFIPAEPVTKLMLAVVRRFKLGIEVEDALEADEAQRETAPRQDAARGPQQAMGSPVSSAMAGAERGIDGMLRGLTGLVQAIEGGASAPPVSAQLNSLMTAQEQFLAQLGSAAAAMQAGGQAAGEAADAGARQAFVRLAQQIMQPVEFQ